MIYYPAPNILLNVSSMAILNASSSWKRYIHYPPEKWPGLSLLHRPLIPVRIKGLWLVKEGLTTPCYPHNCKRLPYF